VIGGVINFAQIIGVLRSPRVTQASLVVELGATGAGDDQEAVARPDASVE